MAFRVTAQDKATNKDQYIIIASSLVGATSHDFKSLRKLTGMPLSVLVPRWASWHTSTVLSSHCGKKGADEVSLSNIHGRIR